MFISTEPGWGKAIQKVLRRLPPIEGAPVRITRKRGLRDERGPIEAGAYLRERRIAFGCTAGEFPRIFAHELFHFVWLRLGNRARREYEAVLERELAAGARGELGWSAEWRKRDLRPADRRPRNRRWREYCCESFCDTAAWMYSGKAHHAEFTLAARYRERRRAWFRESVEGKRLSI
jgi:hypothetical protein